MNSKEKEGAWESASFCIRPHWLRQAGNSVRQGVILHINPSPSGKDLLPGLPIGPISHGISLLQITTVP